MSAWPALARVGRLPGAERDHGRGDGGSDFVANGDKFRTAADYTACGGGSCRVAALPALRRRFIEKGDDVRGTNVADEVAIAPEELVSDTCRGKARRDFHRLRLGNGKHLSAHAIGIELALVAAG